MDATPNTVFLLGAGFSRSIDLDMPLMGELPSLLDFKEGSSAKPFCDQTFQDDFEAWLSSLASVCPWVGAKEQRMRTDAFLEVLKAIQVGLIEPTSRIIEQYNFLAMDNDPYHWIFRLLDYWHQNRSSVITLNYDTIVEGIAKYYLFGRHGNKALESDFYPESQSPAASFQLYKLHGSINLWSRDPLKGSNLQFVETCNKETISKSLEEGYFPYIVPPLSVKDNYYGNSGLGELWQRASSRIKKADRLVVMGYSFPASDWIMKVFLRDLKPDAAVEVIDVSNEAFERASSIFSAQGHAVRKFIDKENPIGNYVANLGAG
jgi:hypothetical protein